MTNYPIVSAPVLFLNYVLLMSSQKKSVTNTNNEGASCGPLFLCSGSQAIDYSSVGDHWFLSQSEWGRGLNPLSREREGSTSTTKGQWMGNGARDDWVSDQATCFSWIIINLKTINLDLHCAFQKECYTVTSESNKNRTERIRTEPNCGRSRTNRIIGYYGDKTRRI